MSDRLLAIAATIRAGVSDIEVWGPDMSESQEYQAALDSILVAVQELEGEARTEIYVARRVAFESGAHWFFNHDEIPAKYGYLLNDVASMAAKLYPLPAAVPTGDANG